jgi:hypothetical protein
MEIPPARIKTAYDRTVRARGGEANHDCQKFRAEFSRQLKKVALEDHLRSSNDFQPVGVADDGDVLWSLVAA